MAEFNLFYRALLMFAIVAVGLAAYVVIICVADAIGSASYYPLEPLFSTALGFD